MSSSIPSYPLRKVEGGVLCRPPYPHHTTPSSHAIREVRKVLWRSGESSSPLGSSVNRLSWADCFYHYFSEVLFPIGEIPDKVDRYAKQRSCRRRGRIAK